jgi:hypothetical protein
VAVAKGGGASAPSLVFVVVNPGLQVVDHGQVFGPGETAQVPEDVAARWIAEGWVVAK